jgi:N-acetylglutamate synthase-like GNAT family acetyltransferase
MSPEDSAAAKKTPRIRFASAKDVPTIMALLRVMHAEIGMASLNEAKVAKKIRDVLERGVICLALADGRPVGTCALEFSQMWYSDDVHLAETWFFVHPDYRQSRNAARLMRFANEIGRQMQLPVLMGVVTTKETERKMHFFDRYMTKVGYLFIGGHR